MLLAGPFAWSVWYVQHSHNTMFATNHHCDPRSLVSFVAALLSYVWRFRHSAVHVAVMHGNSTLPLPLPTIVDISGGGPDQSSAGILFLPWPSRIVLIVEFAIAITHLILTGVYFTKLGLPLTTVNDVELGFAHQTAVPGSAGNVASPGMNQAVPHEAVDACDPVAAIAPDDVDGSTLNEYNLSSGSMEHPESEVGDGVVSC